MDMHATGRLTAWPPTLTLDLGGRNKGKSNSGRGSAPVYAVADDRSTSSALAGGRAQP
jgi:hypothetical protein